MVGYTFAGNCLPTCFHSDMVIYRPCSLPSKLYNRDGGQVLMTSRGIIERSRYICSVWAYIKAKERTYINRKEILHS